MEDGEILVSSGRGFELGFFSPGNSEDRHLGILYKFSPETVGCLANRNNPLTDADGVLAFSNVGECLLVF